MTTTAPTSVELAIHKLTANIGAEVVGLDISQTISADTVARLRAAINEHKVLVFHDVDVDDEGQQRFAGSFGPLTTSHPIVPHAEGGSRVLPVDSEHAVANHWHTDVTFVVNPPQLSTLRSIELPPYGGETLIANQGAAYRSLPDRIRELADGLWAVHSNKYDYVNRSVDDLDEQERRNRAAFTSTVYETAHPVVRVHPLTGEKGLFIGGFAGRILGLSNDESRDLLRILQSYVSRPENVLQLKWRPRQLVIFDNRITQHYAPDNFDRLPRRLARVTVAGDVPAGVDGRQSYTIQGDASHYTTVLQLAGAS